MYVQYSTPDDSMVLKATNRIGFFGSVFGQSIEIGAPQGVTVQVHSTAGTVFSGSFPNVKYISSTQCDFGTGTKLLTQIPFELCTLKIRVQSGSLAAVRLPVVKLIAHNSTTPAVAPSNMTVYGFKKGDTTWTTMAGSAAPLVLSNESAPYVSSGSYVHDYYVCLSVTPTAYVAGTVSFSLYLEKYL